MTTADGLVVVEVRDRINPALAGHEGCAYTSPPQRREHALSLVALLLGCPAHVIDGREAWTTSVAGGRRTITLTTIHP